MASLVDKETRPEDIEPSGSSTSLDMAEKREPDSVGDTDLESGLPVQLDWESPDDPGNPRNWPKAKKVFHTAVPALYGFVK